MYLDEDDQKQSPAAASATQFPSSSSPISSGGDAAAHIRVGSYYELDHSKLPSVTPLGLTTVRLAMVSGKSRRNVSLRFPSVESLEEYFGGEVWEGGKMLPLMDERVVIGSELAAEALYRRILPHEIAVRRNVRSFWVVPPLERDNLAAKNGDCLSHLKSSRMVHWGQRRLVRFLSPRSEERKERILAIEGTEKLERGNEESDGQDLEQAEEEEDEENEPIECRTTRKRRHNQCTYRSTDAANRGKREKGNQIPIYKQTKRKLIKNSIDRWSAERYKLAEVNMLKILKETGAVFGNPILRPALRTEARKLIGDTGLLDHLLKHMAGKVAPGGKERFMRRHNAEGAMEYWLESADLMKIRKEAGVQDPYWTPPPGWKLGDNPNQDPVCAREIRELKEQITKLREQMEDNMGRRHEEDLAIVNKSNSSISSEKLDNDNLSLQLKELFTGLVNKKSKIEEQMMSVSQSLLEIEEEMEKLRSLMSDYQQKKPTTTETTMTLPGSTTPSAGTTREIKTGEERNKSAGVTSRVEQKESALMEGRTSKIERLKSGFRICKPQGTFLWPSMAVSPHFAAPLDDHIAVPTPPSVSSSTTNSGHCAAPSPPPHGAIYTPHPVKPLAERRPVNFSLTQSPDKIALPPHINLNAAPQSHNNNNGFCVSLSQNESSASMFTYQRRYHCITTSPANAMQRLGASEKENRTSHWEEQKGCTCTASASISVGIGTWLALASPTSSLDSNPRK